MKGNADIVAQDTLLFAFSSGNLAQQNSRELTEMFKLGEMLKSSDMSRIIRKHLIKEEIAVLKASRVDRNNQAPLSEIIILGYQRIRIRYT